MRWLKYALISSFCILLFSFAAFAADEPVVATLNGVGYPSLSSAFADAQSGDRVEAVSDSSFSSNLNVPSGVNFIINPGVTISTSSSQLRSNGNVTFHGNVVRTNESTDTSYLVVIESGSASFFGSSVISDSYGNGIDTYSGSNVTFYGGYYSALRYALNCSRNPTTFVYGGSFHSANGLGPVVQASPLPSGVSRIDSSGSSIFSWGPLYQIGLLVSSSITWISLLCVTIFTNKLLLVFVIVIFVGVGLGLLKRVCRY